MLALSVTCRPHFQPWLLHQLAKQEHDHDLFVFDDATKPMTWPKGTTVIRPDNRLKLTLGEKRETLLEYVRSKKFTTCGGLGDAQYHPFAWFDDDDWHSKERLTVAERLLDYVDVVGYESGVFCDVKTLQTRTLNTGDRVCFNSAVYGGRCAVHKFQPVTRGEDTLWQREVLKDATIVSAPVMQHVWLSGDWNVTGRRGSMSFEGPRFSRFDSWELDFLRKL